MELDQHLIKKLTCGCKTRFHMRSWALIESHTCAKCLTNEHCDLCGIMIKAEEESLKFMCGHIVHQQCRRKPYSVTDGCAACLDGLFI